MNVQIRDLFHLYERDNFVTVALRGLHLEISDGEFLVVRGSNGSGKSTLVKILTGFLSQSAGEVFLNGIDLRQIEPVILRRDFVSSVDQKGNLLPDFTVEQNLVLSRSLDGNGFDNAQSWAVHTLQEYGLTSIAKRYAPQLSAAERQVCSLLMAIATNAQLLIADEPSGDLDEVNADRIYSLLRSIAGSMTVVLVTHDVRAEAYADRVVKISGGRVSERWIPGGKHEKVVDPFGWMHADAPIKNRKPALRKKNHSAGTPLLIAKELSLYYGDKAIFSDVNLELAPGGLSVISSPAGGGKSSLLRILAGIQSPTKGSIYFEGHDLDELSDKDRASLRGQSIGYLAQGLTPLRRTTLEDYLGAAIPKLGEEYSSRHSRALSGFSGGERAKIELVRLLEAGKKLLILDEPTSSLDEIRSQEMIGAIHDYVNSGGTAVISTREPLLIDRADRLIQI